MLTTPPNAIEFSYGIDSSLIHQAAAARQGIAFQSLALPHLSLDVDTPSDIELLVAKANPIVEGVVSQWG